MQGLTSELGLFLDCSANPFLLGLLDHKNNWIFFSISDYKNDLHNFIYHELKKHNLNINNVSNFFIVHGPGSYTGLRQSFIFSQTLAIAKKNVYTFYHEEVLSEAKAIHQLDSDVFVANAFKNTLYFQNLSDTHGELLGPDEYKIRF
jgi:tRNA A37 threonylcarbamoyladenosine modification protein TsaB